MASRWANGLIFIIFMWLLSRVVVVVAMQGVAPLLHLPPVNHSYPNLGFVPNYIPTPGWQLFAHWDGAWYKTIATSGYGFTDGKYSNIAFFPFFPLITRGVMLLGLPFEVAGTLVNNLAFLGSLLILYRWVQEHHGTEIARWTTAVLAWCPYSLFGTVIYTEGLFLFLSTASLQAFDNHQHLRAALWGAMASATRITGAALVPALLITAWKERRPATAYVAGLATGGGLLLFSIYCSIRFGDPLAFVHVQQAWRASLGLDWLAWFRLLVDGLAFGTEFIKAIMILGGGYLLWHLGHRLSTVVVAYGFCALALILASGSLSSVDRYAYGIVSLAIALGMLLARHPRWGYATLGYFTILLIAFSFRFAWWTWRNC